VAETVRELQGDEIAASEVFAGRYRIGRLIGHGGMGQVFRAEDLYEDTFVALKMVAEGDGSREASIQGRINHEHVVRVLDMAVDGPKRALVLEYIDGESLAEFICKSYKDTGPPQTLCRLAHQLATALGAIHDAGVIHDDLKPENIIITRRDGELHAMICDFGIAVAPGHARPQDGRNCGTPDYMSPERRRDEAPSRKADIFSLGRVYSFMFSEGHLPTDTQVPVSIAWFSNRLLQLVEGMVDKRSFSRPSCEEICADLETVIRSLSRDAAGATFGRSRGLPVAAGIVAVVAATAILTQNARSKETIYATMETESGPVSSASTVSEPVQNEGNKGDKRIGAGSEMFAPGTSNPGPAPPTPAETAMHSTKGAHDSTRPVMPLTPSRTSPGSVPVGKASASRARRRAPRAQTKLASQISKAADALCEHIKGAVPAGYEVTLRLGDPPVVEGTLNAQDKDELAKNFERVVEEQGLDHVLLGNGAPILVRYARGVCHRPK